MNRSVRYVGLMIALAVAPAASASTVDPLDPVGRSTLPANPAAPTPPMGWSSWNAFRTEITEDKLIGSAQALVSTGLASLGYVYVNIDDGWWQKRRESDGRLEVRTGIFPSAAIAGGRDTSLRPLVDRLHGMGLRVGIYTDVGRNACSQAYDLASPNLPTGTTREREVGLAGHVDQDMRLFFAEWGFDYVKVDACGLADYAADRPYVRDKGYRPMTPVIVRGQPARTDDAAVRLDYQAVADAVRRYDRTHRAVLSICTWGQANVRSWGKDVGNSWRTGEDITPNWSSMLQSFDTAAGRALYAHPGAWNDPDMLFIGTGDFDQTHLTEARSHFSLWAIINAPLLIGFDLRHAAPGLLKILGNREVVAINQDPGGHQGVIAYDAGDLQIIVKSLADGSKAVAILNRSGSPIKANLIAEHLHYAVDVPVRLTDLWQPDRSLTFTRETEMTLAPHETRLFRATGHHQLGTGRYVSELPGSVNVAVDGVRQPELDPTIYRGVSAWSGSRSGGERPMYTGWGGAQADRAVYGTTLTVAGQPFNTGVGILSGSRMEVINRAGFTEFSAKVGIDDGTRARTRKVRFFVYGDGRLLAATPAMSFAEHAREIKADTAGVRLVELIVRNEGAADAGIAVAWGEAALKKNP
jgi:alpha-galactosidase